MDHVTFPRFLARVTSSHLVTYFVAGILAYGLLDYATLFQSALSCVGCPRSFFRRSPFRSCSPRGIGTPTGRGR